MEKQTFERALHCWPDWKESIVKSRQLLGYNPQWPQQECVNWIEQNYIQIRDQGKAELRRLGLPATLQQYWEDCFYSDYQAEDGTINFDKITCRLSDRKSLPDLPCSWGIVWHEGEDIYDPWLRIEIHLHARFATKELFKYAARYAYQTVEDYLWRNSVVSHPVCQWLKGGRPQAYESLAIECAKLKDEEGWTYCEIGKHFGWSLQRDSYGNLNQCSAARRYVKWGRELKEKEYQQ